MANHGQLWVVSGVATPAYIAGSKYVFKLASPTRHSPSRIGHEGDADCEVDVQATPCLKPVSHRRDHLERSVFVARIFRRYTAGMLALTRRQDEVLRIGHDIAVAVLDIQHEEVTLQVDYPAGLLLQGAAFEIRQAPDLGPAGAPPSSPPSRLRAIVVLRVEGTIRIGDAISVKVIGFPTGHAVRLGLEAPREMAIRRDEQGPGKPPPP